MEGESVSKVDAKGTTSYEYDDLNRLNEVTDPSDVVTSYTFDASGNRATETIVDGTTTTEITYTCNDQNRLTGIEKQVNDVTTETTSYTYDNNGNQLTTTVTPYIDGEPGTPAVTATNTYDDLNQLTQTVAGSTTVDNTYNGEGYRVEKTVGTNVTKYLYEADKVILEVDGSNNQTGRNMYGVNLLSRTAGGNTMDYLYNGHADVTALINSSGTVVGSYYYDAFGTITEQTGTANNSINYAGYQYDPESKTYYLNARMYDPATARFLQEDVVRGDVKDPLSLNLYTYCHNEPIMYTDPTGHLYQGQTVQYGSEGADVIKLQKRLEALGYLTMPTDKNGNKVAYGYFGEITLNAVNAYKKAKGLQNDTAATAGKVGATTWGFLGLKLQEGTSNDKSVVYQDSKQDTGTSQSANTIANSSFYYQMGGPDFGLNIPVTDPNPMIESAGQALNTGFKRMDDWGNATWVNDPIPNSTPDGLGYIDNAAAGIAMGLGKAGEAIAKTLQRAEEVFNEVKGTRAATGPTNKIAGTGYENYVEATKLKGVDTKGMLQTQQDYVVKDLVTGKNYVVRPDFEIWNANEELASVAAIADAKSGAITLDSQARGLIQVAANSTTSKTLIYYVPEAGSVPWKLYNAAQSQGVKILEIVVK